MTKIDLDKPIEAVRKSDGRVFPVTVSSREGYDGGFYTKECPDSARTNCGWYADGSDMCGYNEWFVRNVTQSIDWDKPLETTDGREVTVQRKADDGSYRVRYDRSGGLRHYHADGTHRFGSMPPLRNVVVAALDTSKPLQTVDGKAVTFLTKTEDGRLVVEVSYRDYGAIGGYRKATELRNADGRKGTGTVHSPDDVIVKVLVTEQFRNVYADGTIGSTIHANEQDAKDRSKYGKVRIAVLKQTLTDGKVTSARVQGSAAPWFRNASFPKGRVATASDY